LLASLCGKLAVGDSHKWLFFKREGELFAKNSRDFNGHFAVPFEAPSGVA
jgi:hypothetical protein